MTHSLYNRETAVFSRQWWLKSVRSLLPVILITVLIWVYADLEFTDTMEFRANLHLNTGKALNLSLLSDKEIHLDSFKIQGSRSSLENYRRDLMKSGGIIDFDVSSLRLNAGENLVQTTEILNHLDELSRNGLTAVAASPGLIRIHLDQKTFQADVPVEFVYTGAELAAPPLLTPSKIGVYVPRGDWERLRDAKPVLKTRSVDLKTIEAGKPVTLTVEVVPSLQASNAPPVAVELEKPAVNVTVQVREATDSKTIPVTVQVITPPTWMEDNVWRDFTLVRKDPLEWRKEITVTGPKEDLGKLRPEDVQAYIVLIDDDKKPVASWLSREVTVRFPGDLALKLTGPKLTVDFKLVKNPAPAAP